jgi:excisionase family DNA binding protein
MGPAACEILADRRPPSDHERPTVARAEKPAVPPKSVPQKEGQVAASGQASLPLLVGIRQASELLGLGRSTIYKLISAGTIRTIKIGNRSLIESAALRALAASGA